MLNYRIHYIGEYSIDCFSFGNITKYINEKSEQQSNIDIKVFSSKGKHFYGMFSRQTIAKGAELFCYYGKDFGRHYELIDAESEEDCDKSDDESYVLSQISENSQSEVSKKQRKRRTRRTKVVEEDKNSISNAINNLDEEEEEEEETQEQDDQMEIEETTSTQNEVCNTQECVEEEEEEQVEEEEQEEEEQEEAEDDEYMVDYDE